MTISIFHVLFILIFVAAVYSIASGNQFFSYNINSKFVNALTEDSGATDTGSNKGIGTARCKVSPPIVTPENFHRGKINITVEIESTLKKVLVDKEVNLTIISSGTEKSPDPARTNETGIATIEYFVGWKEQEWTVIPSWDGDDGHVPSQIPCKFEVKLEWYQKLFNRFISCFSDCTINSTGIGGIISGVGGGIGSKYGIRYIREEFHKSGDKKTIDKFNKNILITILFLAAFWIGYIVFLSI